jgi:hypothetical protein
MSGAPVHEIEVTPAMIDAGIKALRREIYIDLIYDREVDLVESIIKNALEALRVETLRAAPRQRYVMTMMYEIIGNYPLDAP